MITYVKGDLLQSPARVLVNTVNTVGVMGKGIAKDLKNIYPEMFRQYQSLCERRMFNVGQLWIYKTPHKWEKHSMQFAENGVRRYVRILARFPGH